MPAGCRPGCGCFSRGPGWSQPHLLLELAPVHEWRVGSSHKILGLENSGKRLRTQAGVTQPCMWKGKGSLPASLTLSCSCWMGLGRGQQPFPPATGYECCVWPVGNTSHLSQLVAVPDLPVAAGGGPACPCPCRSIVGSLLPTSVVPGLHSPAGAREDTCLWQGQVGLLGECSPFPTPESQRHRLWDVSSGIELWWA